MPEGEAHLSNLRVLHVLSSLDETYGGPLRVVLDLSARAEGNGLVSEVLGVGNLSIRDNPLDPSKFHSVPLGPGGPVYAYSPALRNWLRANLMLFDGVVLHGAWTYPVRAAARECRRAGVPYAYFTHGMLEKWAVDGQSRANSLKKRLYWHLAEKSIARYAKRLFFTTAREMELSRATFHLPSIGAILRPYGIETRVESVPQPGNESLAQPAGMKIALFLGRLHPKKNVKLLIQAWHLAQMPPEWRLVIAGSGAEPYVGELRSLVGEYGIDDQIVFADFVSGLDKSYLLQRAAWFLLPSNQESFGVAVLEAVQNDCAVAISDQVYLTESMRPDSEIIPVNLEAWVEFMRTRMRDTAWRDRVRDLDRAHLLAAFGIRQVTESWVGALTEAFSSNPRPVLSGHE